MSQAGDAPGRPVPPQRTINAWRIPSDGTENVVVDRWPTAPTVEFTVQSPVRVRRLLGGGQPPNLPAWPTNRARNVRPDMPRDPRKHAGWWPW